MGADAEGPPGPPRLFGSADRFHGRPGDPDPDRHQEGARQEPRDVGGLPEHEERAGDPEGDLRVVERRQRAHVDAGRPDVPEKESDARGDGSEVEDRRPLAQARVKGIPLRCEERDRDRQQKGARIEEGEDRGVGNPRRQARPLRRNLARPVPCPS